MRRRQSAQPIRSRIQFLPRTPMLKASKIPPKLQNQSFAGKMADSHEIEPQAKRRKIFNESSSGITQPVAIASSHQLRSLLVFQQSVSQEVKQGIRTFKDFLTSIVSEEDEKAKAKKLQILKSYCDSQVVKDAEGKPTACFLDLLQTWAFAESNNEESLLSLIPSVLALFLKTVSGQLSFRDFGRALCKFLLQKDQLKLFNRGLTASKSKEHLISPCLRLLTEVVSFDGGAIARVVYASRYITFKRLDIFLSGRKSNIEEEPEDHRKPSLRRIAQRYLLANFKFQGASAKEELVSQGKLIKAFLEEIRKDARDIVIDIIKTIDKHIVSDAELPRNSKSRFLNRSNLERLVTLYGYEKDSTEPTIKNECVSDEIHKFMLSICTSQEKGVLLPETGWYPFGSTPNVLPPEDTGCISLGLDSPVYFDKYKESVPVRNGNLSSLVQFLRPESDTLQMELLLKIFRAAPELVYEFFSKRTMFTSDPKPTPSWLGESAFLFSSVQLPVPAQCGWKGVSPPVIPPPISIVIESIIPRPLTQKILTRCINQNADVVTLFAIRITTLALRKLQAVLKLFECSRDVGQDLWSDAAAKLVAEFCRRCPAMKDAIAAFRQTPKDNIQQQDAVLELLSMFYQVIPAIALKEKFDVSLTLVDVLKQLDNSELSGCDKQLLFSQLQSLLIIAQESPTMRWWQKPGSLEFSAFTSVLKVVASAPDNSPLEEIKPLLQDILVHNSVLADRESFSALTQGLTVSAPEDFKAQLDFIDNCVTRLVKRPVLYLDQGQSLLGSGSQKLSLLATTVNEQWSFVVKAGNRDGEVAVAGWIAQLLGSLKNAGEEENALARLRDAMMEATETKKSRSLLKKALKSREKMSSDKHEKRTTRSITPQVSTSEKIQVSLPDIFGKCPVEDESHPGLHRWEKDDLELALDQGYVGELILCLCSEHEEIRRQAIIAISRFMARLQESTYSERQTMYVLMGELLETAKENGVENTLPYIAGELGARLLEALMDPLHKLYGKANTFLNKGPLWEIAKIPSYWIDKILLHESEYDDSHYEEVSWLLDLFVNGLRSKKDLDIYRRASVFERLLSLYSSPNLSESLRKKILHLVFRACEVGGNTTLLTRAAAISWILSQTPGSVSQRQILQALARELYDGCDHEWINRWSGLALPKTIAQISG
ncbi:hypothetical protein D8B26_002373 [Coccidioides posadasii str. Silveira]|nr:hypothetical protein CPAG_02137 [Coccidioides posadasii RMSCC 3488]QVM07681.1 hypothetical protein D8B26_002373 [Coccidioides posadasii str. Silveira]